MDTVRCMIAAALLLLVASAAPGRAKDELPKRGYLVVAPVGSGYGAAAIDIRERAPYEPFFSIVAICGCPQERAGEDAAAICR